MTPIKMTAAALLAAAASACQAGSLATPVRSDFGSTGQDRAAIETLLDTYTRAVSTKDQALFETILLDKDITFSYVDSSADAKAIVSGAHHYDAFRRGVFNGPPFTQKFQDVHISQDGALAAVSLVYVNSFAESTSWGWKTLQLLRVSGQWKIASELYTGHR